jgi:hypothetical protein
VLCGECGLAAVDSEYVGVDLGDVDCALVAVEELAEVEVGVHEVREARLLWQQDVVQHYLEEGGVAGEDAEDVVVGIDVLEEHGHLVLVHCDLRQGDVPLARLLLRQVHLRYEVVLEAGDVVLGHTGRGGTDEVQFALRVRGLIVHGQCAAVEREERVHLICTEDVLPAHNSMLEPFYLTQQHPLSFNDNR